MGSFDPVHNGHRKLVETALKTVEMVVIVPAHQNPFKKESTPFTMRFQMLLIAFEDLIREGKVVISDLEEELSIETNMHEIPSWMMLSQFKKKYGEDFVIVTTVETINEMKEWQKPELLANFRYIVYAIDTKNVFIDQNAVEMFDIIPVNGNFVNDELIDKFGHYVRTPHSSQIRKGSNSFRKKYLHEGVLKYINETGLYEIGRNWCYTIKDGDHAGVTLYSGCYCAVAGIVYKLVNGVPFFLANKRGEGCPDYNGYWNLTCGFKERNENGQEAISREIVEECGIKIPPEAFIQHYVETEPAYCNNGNVTIRYRACVNDTIMKNVGQSGGEENEVDDVRWIPYYDIEKYEWAFNHYDILYEFIDWLYETKQM